MLEQRVAVAVDTGLAVVWTYVSDIANWASNMPGYRSFEAFNERQSLWVMKIGFGTLVRTVTVRVQIEDWQEPDRVAFTYRLDGDPVDGDGSYVANVRPDGGTDIELGIRINGQGPMATMWEALARPILPKMVNGFAQALKCRIEEFAGPDDAGREGQSQKGRAATMWDAVRRFCQMVNGFAQTLKSRIARLFGHDNSGRDGRS